MVGSYEAIHRGSNVVCVEAGADCIEGVVCYK